MESRQWYEAKTGNHQGLVVEEGTGNNIAVTYDKTDACLIAASPELLFACENALEDPDDDHAIRVIEDAIAKAKGE